MRSARVLLLLMAFIAAGTGVLVYRGLVSNAAVSAEAVGELLRLRLPDANGNLQGVSQLQKKILVVNFWATWCEPCRREIPGMVRIQSQYGSKGVQVVGIALDSPAKVRQFAKDFGINYSLMIGGMETMDLARKLGNSASALPYTVVVARSGKVMLTHLGAISDSELERVIRPELS